MTDWKPEVQDEDDPVRSALELGLRRQPLDAAALARVREAVRSEFDTLYGWRGGRRRWPIWVASMAATLAAVTVIAAVFLFQSEVGPAFGSVLRVERGALQTSTNFFRKHELGVGEEVLSQEDITSSGASLIALAQGGVLRVAPGTTLEGVSAGEVILRSGQVYLDFPKGAGDFVLRTAVGTFEHVGTQFEAAVRGGETLVRVREGSVKMSTGDLASERVEAGTEVVVSKAGSITRRSLPTYGPDWAWAESIAPEFEIENRALADFLTWVARETGRHVEFADDRARELAGHTLLHGSVHGLAPLAALQQVLSTTSLRYEIHDDVIRVSSPR